MSLKFFEPSAPGTQAQSASNRTSRIKVLERQADTGGGTTIISGGGSVDLTPFVRKDTLTAPGALYVATAAGVVTEILVGVDNTVLTANSAVAEGVSWQAAGLNSEAVQDLIASTLVAGSNVTLSYNDPAGTLTISSTGGGGGGFPSYPITNAGTDTTLNANSTTIDELADFIATIIADWPAATNVYTTSNVTTDRSLPNAASTTIDELADIAATVAEDIEANNTLTAYTVGGYTALRVYNANSTTLDELAAVLCTFINDVQTGATSGGGTTPDNAYRLAHQSPVAMLVAQSTGTWVPLQGGQTASLGGGVSTAVPVFRLVAADYAVTGKTPKLRVRAECDVSQSPGAVTFTVGLYPLTAIVTGPSAIAYTLGTVVSGSTVAFASPSAGSFNFSNSGDFTLPSDGPYVLAVNVSANMAASSLVNIPMILQVRTV